MDERAGEQMKEFQKLTNPAGIDFVRAAAFRKGTTKRKAGETSSNQPVKRPVSIDEVQEAVRHGHVSFCSCFLIHFICCTSLLSLE